MYWERGVGKRGKGDARGARVRNNRKVLAPKHRTLYITQTPATQVRQLVGEGSEPFKAWMGEGVHVIGLMAPSELFYALSQESVSNERLSSASYGYFFCFNGV